MKFDELPLDILWNYITPFLFEMDKIHLRLTNVKMSTYIGSTHKLFISETEISSENFKQKLGISSISRGVFTLCKEFYFRGKKHSFDKYYNLICTPEYPKYIIPYYNLDCLYNNCSCDRTIGMNSQICFFTHYGYIQINMKNYRSRFGGYIHRDISNLYHPEIIYFNKHYWIQFPHKVYLFPIKSWTYLGNFHTN